LSKLPFTDFSQNSTFLVIPWTRHSVAEERDKIKGKNIKQSKQQTHTVEKKNNTKRREVENLLKPKTLASLSNTVSLITV